MKHLINCQRLVSSNDIRENILQNLVYTLHKSKTNILKKIVLVGFALIAFFGNSYAQNNAMRDKHDITNRLRNEYKSNSADDVNKIPISTRNEFSEDFSNVKDVTWKVESDYNEADFTMNNKSMMAFFNFDDELIGSGYYVDYADIPEKGREHIEKDYGDYTPEKALFFDDNQYYDLDFLNFFGNSIQKDAYFVLLSKEDKEIVVQVDEDGEVSYFNSAK